MTPFRDRRLEEELHLGGLDASAAKDVFGDLTTYLRQPIEETAKEYWRYHEGEDVIAQRRVGEAKEEAAVLAYYAATPHYLYELSYWEASLDKQAWFRVVALACRKYGLWHVMDFGGGVGGLSRYLHSRGIRCDHLDVAGRTFDYAAWRFARRNLDVTMLDVTSPARQPKGPYDAIVAWDVLEHLFDLDGAIQNIAGLLRPNGWFMSKSTFAVAGGVHEAIHLAQHACYADVAAFNELVARSGFRYLGQLKPNRFSRLLRSCGMPYTVTGIRITPRLKHGGNFLVHERVVHA